MKKRYTVIERVVAFWHPKKVEYVRRGPVRSYGATYTYLLRLRQQDPSRQFDIARAQSWM